MAHEAFSRVLCISRLSFLADNLTDCRHNPVGLSMPAVKQPSPPVQIAGGSREQRLERLHFCAVLSADGESGLSRRVHAQPGILSSGVLRRRKRMLNAGSPRLLSSRDSNRVGLDAPQSLQTGVLGMHPPAHATRR